MKPARLLLVALLLSTTSLRAQSTYEPPERPDLNNAADFKRYEPDVIAATTYLKSTPLGVDTAHRKQVAGFLMQWLIGSPDVSINARASILAYVSEPADLMLLYMGGWGVHVIQTSDTTELGGNLAGIRTVLGYYADRNNRVPRNKGLDKLKDLDDEGKLAAFVKKLMAEE